MKIPRTFIPETKLDEKLEDLLKKDSEKKKMTKLKEPEIGMRVYAPDFVGSICKIRKIDKNYKNDGEKTIFVAFEEHPDLWCNWDYLQENQAEWKEEYDNKIRNKDSDSVSEFNDW